MRSLAEEFPARSFVGRYLRRARELADAPEIFHAGAALVALSSVFAPRAKGGAFPLNLWIGLVGASAADMPPPGAFDEPPLRWTDRDRRSVERSFEFFRAHPRGVLILDWNEVLERLRRPSWSPGCDLLRELHVGRSMSRAVVDRAARGRYREPRVTTIKSPCLSMLAAFRGTRTKLPESVRALMGAMLWLDGGGRSAPRLPRPDRAVRAEARLREMTAKLRLRSSGCPGVVFGRGAALAISEWRKNTAGSDPRIAAALLRAAALDVLGRRRGRVGAADVERAIRVFGPAAIAGAAKASVKRW